MADGRTAGSVSLQGSTETVGEFFSYALSSILYQRGVYPAENFEPVKKYGLTVMMVKDPKLYTYLQTVLKQFRSWLETSTLQKVVLVITSASSKQVLERWSFDIHMETSDADGKMTNSEKPEGVVMKEIQAIIRQITASVTFLPLLNDTCTIDLLAYTDRNSDVPIEWEESDARLIDGAANVKLRSFATSVHAVDAAVSYKTE